MNKELSLYNKIPKSSKYRARITRYSESNGKQMKDFKQKSVGIKFTFYSDHSAYSKKWFGMSGTGGVREAIKPPS